MAVQRLQRAFCREIGIFMGLFRLFLEEVKVFTNPSRKNDKKPIYKNFRKDRGEGNDRISNYRTENIDLVLYPTMNYVSRCEASWE